MYELDFYELLCISYLSENKFKELLLKINPNEIKRTFWEHICLRICEPKLKEDIQKDRYSSPHNVFKKDVVYAQTVVVCGFNGYNQLGTKFNNNYKDPPKKFPLDSSSYLCYSVYDRHAVNITNDNSLLGCGDNSPIRISTSFSKTGITQFSEFCIRDSSGNKLDPFSVVCCFNGTVYMFNKSCGYGRQLVLCDCNINDWKEVFLDTGDQELVALFGGCLHAAAINNKGEVIFINCSSIKNSPSSQLASFSLPDGEKASSVACCDDSIVVLSSKWRVYSSVVKSGSSVLSFSAVSELLGEEIVYVSGTCQHCLCVNKEARVFGRGSNSNGRLGLGKETRSVSSFTAISSLCGYKIRAAYAGGSHSLFETSEGKILSCGRNYYGQILLSSGKGDDVYSPKETMITEGATFCIAGFNSSVVFFGGEPPPTTPNRLIQQ